jgi:hypothetical protein
MPYITEEQRNRILGGDSPRTPGELNYKITNEVNSYLYRYGTSYAVINEIIGILESAKMEFYRRVAVPYEDNKRAENGDVYS